VLYSFEGYGEPAGELATQIGGTLYGFAPNGGSEKELGTVFSYTP